jgi:hypothetical protein
MTITLLATWLTLSVLLIIVGQTTTAWCPQKQEGRRTSKKNKQEEQGAKHHHHTTTNALFWPDPPNGEATREKDLLPIGVTRIHGTR